MNITPNSFSDPGSNLSEEGFERNFLQFLDQGFTSLDFGAESTASKNAGLVDDYEEWNRIESYLIPKLEIYKEKFSQLEYFSLDTYRFLTFTRFEKIFHEIFPKTILIWNDVSGVIDEDFFHFLNLYKEKMQLGLVKYVASFSFVPSRELTSFHMDYVRCNDNIIQCFLKKEEELVNLFSEHNILNSLIFDPAFGFSKTHEQNFTLLEFCLSKYNPKVFLLLIGLSKKSFLREKIKILNPCFKNSDFEALLILSESLHKEYINRFLTVFLDQNGLTKIWFRVHDPCLFNDLTTM